MNRHTADQYYLAAIDNKYEEVPEPQSRVEELLKEWFEKTK